MTYFKSFRCIRWCSTAVYDLEKYKLFKKESCKVFGSKTSVKKPKKSALVRSSSNLETFHNTYEEASEALFGKVLKESVKRNVNSTQLVNAKCTEFRKYEREALNSEETDYSVVSVNQMVSKTSVDSKPSLLGTELHEPDCTDGCTVPINKPASERSMDSSLSELLPILSYPLLHVRSIDSSLKIVPASAQFAYFKAVPSVTLILEKTRPVEEQHVLDLWKAKMIGKLGALGFQQWKEETLAKGQLLHATIEDWLQGKRDNITIAPANRGHWESLGSTLDVFSGVQATEHRLQHDELLYRGIIDCVATYRGIPSIVEWKTSKNPKRTLADTFDNPMQVAAYMGLWNRSVLSGNHNPLGEAVTQGVLVIAYESCEPADVLVMDAAACEYYWKKWLSRLHSYWKDEMARTQGAEEATAARAQAARKRCSDENNLQA